MISTPERRWTAETGDVIAKTLMLPPCTNSACYSNHESGARMKAGTILGILADAGLLLPPDSEVREDLEVRSPGLRYLVNDMRHAWLQYGELRSKGWDAEIVTRTVHTGPPRRVDIEGGKS